MIEMNGMTAIPNLMDDEIADAIDLPEGITMNSEINVRQIPIPVLAYIGDAVFELYARVFSLKTARWKMKEIHQVSVSLVKAESQANLLHQLEPILTNEEKEMVRRGRNAKSGQIPKGVTAASYRYSTAFETLIGYLYLTGRHDRLKELICHVGMDVFE